MASIEQFFDYVASHVTDADEDLLRFNIQEAVTDFMYDTKIATAYHRFSMQDNIHDYVIDIPECHTIVSVKRVLMGSRCDNTVDWVELKRTEHRDRIGYALDIINEGQPEIWIGEPCGNSDVEIEYVYAMTRGGCEIPDFIYQRYARAIQYLALSKLYGIIGQSWSDPALSVNMLNLYNAELSKIKRSIPRFKGGPFKAKSFIGGSCFGCGRFWRE